MIDSPGVKTEKQQVLFSSKVTLKSRAFTPWIYFMSLISVLPVLIWIFLQFHPLQGMLSGSLFIFSLLCLAIVSTPYRAAKRLKNFPLYISLTKNFLFLKQGKREWTFEINSIEKIHSYRKGPLYGLEISSQHRRYAWLFVDALTVEKLQNALKYRPAEDHAIE